MPQRLHWQILSPASVLALLVGIFLLLQSPSTVLAGSGASATGTLPATPPTVPQQQQSALGSPIELQAYAIGDGHVLVSWQAARNADAYWIWSSRTDGSDGRWTPADGTANLVTVSGLENGQVYWFIAIAGRNLDGQQEWSLWSNWARAQPSGALSTEKAALVALYIATAGSNWIISANWLSDAPIGQWYGVTSDDHGRVVRLALAGNGLIGEIPPELVSLTNVTSLDLGRNGLTGNIPAGLSTLANLSILDLSDNQLTGEIPEALASLNSLTSLKLSRNFFTGCVPSRLRSIADNDLSELGLPVCDATTLPGAETIDFGTLENARYLERQMPRAAAAIKALPWVSDGIAASEKAAVQRLLYVAPFYPEVFNILIQWPWLRDGVNDVELSAINGIHAIAYYNEGIAVQFVQLPWLADGVSPMEGSAVRHISIIAQIDPTAAGRIIKMPFLATIDPPDVTALLSLTRLAHVAPQRFQYVMSHPALSAGITDDLARIVALLHGVNETNPSLIETLLDPDRVTVEERPVHLPLSGRVDLAIIRTRAGAELSMDLLEHSVQSAEALIGEPLPTNYVALLFENAVSPGSAGTNFQTHVAIKPVFDVDDGSYQAERAGHVIAHEVSHYYWRGNQDWVDEGAADFMASISENARTGRPIEATNYPCAYATNISVLEQLNGEIGADAFECNYALGERLFLDLYRNVGHDRFRRGFRILYRASLADENASGSGGTSIGIEHVRNAFSVDAKDVIARWYDGTQLHDVAILDSGPVDPRLPAINGRIDRAYVTSGLTESELSSFSAQGLAGGVCLFLKYSYNVSGGPHEAQLEMVEYFEDGFVIGRRSITLPAEGKYIGGAACWSIGPSADKPWASGRYWAYVYDGDRKVAEVEYAVTP